MADDNAKQYTISWNMSIGEIDQAAWDALAEPLATPLLEWEWLHQLEASGSVTAENGWLPVHLTVWREGVLVGAAPLYIKGHSQGEFVYDYAWADVASQLGVQYYPKLVGMSPATPAVGYRFLISPDEDERQITRLMLEAIDTFCAENKLSGASFLFVDPAWRHQVESYGYATWMHQSFEWINQGFDTFDDYLQSFTKNQRRNIRRERSTVESQDVEVRPFFGEEIPEHFFKRMYRFYENTNDQFGPWAAKYLTRSFFRRLYPAYRSRLLFIAAFEKSSPDDPIAMSFLLHKGETIIGRYWGATRQIDSLHFDACYYSPIEWAIEHGVKHFDPGAGSPHKLRRGFFAVANYSLHRFMDRRLRNLMSTYIDEINRNEQRRIDAMNASLPLKQEYMPQSMRSRV